MTVDDNLEQMQFEFVAPPELVFVLMSYDQTGTGMGYCIGGFTEFEHAQRARDMLVKRDGYLSLRIHVMSGIREKAVIR